jgi:hypothetical protein
VLHHVFISILVHEAFQGAEATDGQQLHVAGVALRALLDVVAALYQSLLVIVVPHHEIDQASTMGRDVPVALPAQTQTGRRGCA